MAASGLLAGLHNHCFELPWPETEIARLLSTPGTSALIALRISEPVGFLIVRQAADEAEIIVIGTRPAARREGIARRLLGDASQSLAAQGVARLFAEVAAGNRPARQLYAGMGFREVGMRRGYYAREGGPDEDAHVMMKNLP